MSDFLQYQMRVVETRAAQAIYNQAQSKLALTQIWEREAELASQSFESLKMATDLGPITERERALSLAFARYVAFGRTDNAGFLGEHGAKSKDYCGGRKPVQSPTRVFASLAEERVRFLGVRVGTRLIWDFFHSAKVVGVPDFYTVTELEWHPDELLYHVEAV